MLLAAWLHIVSAVVFVGLAVFLMFIILLQRGKGVGLAGAFGGTGGQTVFGSKTGDVLTLATVIFASIFLFFTIILNLWVFQPVKSDFGSPSIGALGGAPAQPAPSTPPPADAMPIEFPMSVDPVSDEPVADEPIADPVDDAATGDEPTADEPAAEPPGDQDR